MSVLHSGVTYFLLHGFLFVLVKHVKSDVFCTCPPECTCDDTVTASCHGYKLKYFPATFCNKIQHLTISDSFIDNFDGKALRGLQDLVTLEIRSSKIVNLHTCTFSGESKVESIKFDNVSIIQTVQNAFSTLRNIKHIEFTNSHINKISPQSFSDIENITNLIFRNNTIDEIDFHAFNEIKSVENFILDRNNFTKRVLNIFSSILTMNLFDVSGNQFGSYFCGIEQTFENVYLSQSKIRVENNSFFCFCNFQLDEISGPMESSFRIQNNNCHNGQSVQQFRASQSCNETPDDFQCPEKRLPAQMPDCLAFPDPLEPVPPIPDPTDGPNGSANSPSFYFRFAAVYVIFFHFLL